MGEDGGANVAVAGGPESRKRRRGCSSGSEDLARVAEIVMVLSAMGQMRGGQDPTAAERALMAEAREKLAKFCESMEMSSRKDLFTKEMAIALVVDHGLNPPKDNVPRPPKLSIADKVTITKKKMEEAREMAVQSSGQASQLMSVSFGVKPESRTSMLHAAQKIVSDKPVSQLPEKLLMPSAQGVLLSAAGPALDAKYHAAHTPGNQHLLYPLPPGTIFYDQSSANSHHDITKIVQRVLPQRPIEQPNWVPPPTDYINRPLQCQICKATINDVESVLVCDACERGVHMKCLSSFNQRLVPKGEWHCPQCLVSSHGKPLPPKYGRVTRSVTTSRASSHSGGVQGTEKRGNVESKVDGEPSSLQVSTVGGSQIESADERNTGNQKAFSEEEFSISERKRDDSNSIPSKQHHINSGLLPCQMQQHISENSSTKEIKLTHLHAYPSSHVSNKDSVTNAVQAQVRCVEQNTSDLMKSFNGADHDAKNENIKFLDHESSSCHESSAPQTDIVRSEKEVIKGKNRGEISERESTELPTFGRQVAEWLGEAVEVSEDRSYYHSCSLKDVVYKVEGHVIISSSDGKVFPSKLEALWEEKTTGIKWAKVRRFYYPSDLPENVLAPDIPWNNEVMIFLALFPLTKFQATIIPQVLFFYPFLP
ncbi:uncharacterized protein LOC144712995 isoform X2 [Wolffia australiana]